MSAPFGALASSGVTEPLSDFTLSSVALDAPTATSTTPASSAPAPDLSHGLPQNALLLFSSESLPPPPSDDPVTTLEAPQGQQPPTLGPPESRGISSSFAQSAAISIRSSSPLTSNGDEDDELMTPPLELSPGPVGSATPSQHKEMGDKDVSDCNASRRLPRSDNGQFVGFTWTANDLDVLFDLLTPEFNTRTHKFPIGSLSGVYSRRLELTGHDEGNAPSLPAIMAKVHRLKSTRDMRWTKLLRDSSKRAAISGKGRGAPHQVNGSSSQPSRRESSVRSSRGFSTGGQPTATTVPSTSTTSRNFLPAPQQGGRNKNHIKVRWSKAEHRLLVRLFQRAHDNRKTSMAAAASYVAKEWTKHVDAKRYRPRTTASLKMMLQKLSLSKTSALRQAATELRSNLLDKTIWNAARWVQVPSAQEELSDGALDKGSVTLRAQADGADERTKTAHSSPRYRPTETFERVSLEDSSPGEEASVQAALPSVREQLQREIDQLTASLLGVADERSEPKEAKGGKAAQGQDVRSGGRLDCSETTPWIPKQDAAADLRQMEEQIEGLQASQQRMDVVSAQAWDTLRRERLELHRDVTRFTKRIEELPTAIDSVIQQQQALSQLLQGIGCRIEELEAGRTAGARVMTQQGAINGGAVELGGGQIERHERNASDWKRGKWDSRLHEGEVQEDSRWHDERRSPPVGTSDVRGRWGNFPTALRRWAPADRPSAQSWASNGSYSAQHLASTSHAVRFGGRYGSYDHPLPMTNTHPQHRRSAYAQPDYGRVSFLLTRMPQEEPRYGREE